MVKLGGWGVGGVEVEVEEEVEVEVEQEELGCCPSSYEVYVLHSSALDQYDHSYRHTASMGTFVFPSDCTAEEGGELGQLQCRAWKYENGGDRMLMRRRPGAPPPNRRAPECLTPPSMYSSTPTPLSSWAQQTGSLPPFPQSLKPTDGEHNLDIIFITDPGFQFRAAASPRGSSVSSDAGQRAPRNQRSLSFNKSVAAEAGMTESCQFAAAPPDLIRPQLIPAAAERSSGGRGRTFDWRDGNRDHESQEVNRGADVEMRGGGINLRVEQLSSDVPIPAEPPSRAPSFTGICTTGPRSQGRSGSIRVIQEPIKPNTWEPGR
ncbi:unnamed protein product [Pleuronectes platessa]|uniref:Uncharacterized protein n=1 Tax=Pleuronectes platessa TaxID=8262 RepID=A0A9N7UE67_PLEPL|nr:unnamed protein product [Pleuronectes platessa]